MSSGPSPAKTSSRQSSPSDAGTMRALTGAPVSASHSNMSLVASPGCIWGPNPLSWRNATDLFGKTMEYSHTRWRRALSILEKKRSIARGD